MGKPQSTGNLVNAIAQDSSNNIGLGGAANASYKLQVTGATNLTGALTGTTGSFSVSVGNSNTGLDLTNSGALGYGNSINFYQNATKAVQIFTESSAANTSEIEFRTLVGGTLAKRFKIEATGAATFSSSVTANAGFYMPAVSFGTSPNFLYTNSLSYGLNATGGNAGVYFGNLYNSSLATAMQFRVVDGGGTNITAMTLNSNGNVGIGNTGSATDRLSVSDGSTYTFNIGAASGGAGAVLATFGSAALTFATNGTSNERMRIKANGDVLIKTALRISDDTTWGLSIYKWSATASPILEADGGQALSFGNGGSEKMRIFANGNVAIQDTFVDNGAKLCITSGAKGAMRINTDATYNAISIGGTGAVKVDYPGVGAGRLELNDAGTLFLRQYSNGTLSISSGQVVSSSDINLKNDDGGIENALSKVLKLNPRYFYWKEDSGIETTERQLGFYAQEVQEALGIEVANENGNDKWGIYDRGIIAMLTKAIQELKAEIEQLKQK